MLFIEFEDKLDVEKLFFEETEDFPPHPTQPPDLVEGGIMGDDGEEYGLLGGISTPLGPFPGMGGLIRKGSLPEGVIMFV